MYFKARGVGFISFFLGVNHINSMSTFIIRLHFMINAYYQPCLGCVGPKVNKPGYRLKCPVNIRRGSSDCVPL